MSDVLVALGLILVSDPGRLRRREPLMSVAHHSDAAEGGESAVPGAHKPVPVEAPGTAISHCS